VVLANKRNLGLFNRIKIMRYLTVIFCIAAFLGCQRTPEMKWYRHVLDSLGRIEAPLIIDTLMFNRQMSGRDRMDTIINDMVIHRSRNYWGNKNYINLQWHIDSLIGDRYEYDGVDGKLLSWSRHFVNHRNFVDYGSIVDYTKWYKKSGKISTFGAGEGGQEPAPMPNFTIHKLIGQLRSEGVDLRNDVIIGQTPADTTRIHWGEISYWKYNWKVDVSHYHNCYRNFASVHCREFDGDTGEVVKEWWDSWGIE